MPSALARRTPTENALRVDERQGHNSHLTGEYLELQPFKKDRPRGAHVFAGPNARQHVETTFEPDGSGTLMTMRMTLPDAETRTRMLATNMEHGMEASYIRLEIML